MYPGHFKDSVVVDCGSLDINGSNRAFFERGEYWGVDIGPGKGVDVVCPVHQLNGQVPPADVVISTEMLEHDRFWKDSVRKMVEILKPGGLLIVTCATFGRMPHGVTGHAPQDSPYTNDYYGNVLEEDFRKVVHWDSLMKKWGVETRGADLQAWGEKNVPVS